MYGGCLLCPLYPLLLWLLAIQKSTSVRRPDEGKTTRVREFVCTVFCSLGGSYAPPPPPQEKQNIVIVSFVENRQLCHGMIFESHLDKDSCERLMHHLIRVTLDPH